MTTDVMQTQELTGQAPPAQGARLPGLHAGEIDLDDVAGGAQGGVGIEMIDERPRGRDEVGCSDRCGRCVEDAAARDSRRLTGVVRSAHARISSQPSGVDLSLPQLLRAMNRPSRSRKVSASPAPCGSSEAFAPSLIVSV